MGYSASSSSVHPTSNTRNEFRADAFGTMEAENTILAGGGAQTGKLHRWGDYSAMRADLVDDCTFRYTTEYGKTSGSIDWSTRIATPKLSDC